MLEQPPIRGKRGREQKWDVLCVVVVVTIWKHHRPQELNYGIRIFFHIRLKVSEHWTSTSLIQIFIKRLETKNQMLHSPSPFFDAKEAEDAREHHWMEKIKHRNINNKFQIIYLYAWIVALVQCTQFHTRTHARALVAMCCAAHNLTIITLKLCRHRTYLARLSSYGYCYCCRRRCRCCCIFWTRPGRWIAESWKHEK